MLYILRYSSTTASNTIDSLFKHILWDIIEARPFSECRHTLDARHSCHHYFIYKKKITPLIHLGIISLIRFTHVRQTYQHASSVSAKEQTATTVLVRNILYVQDQVNKVNVYYMWSRWCVCLCVCVTLRIWFGCRPNSRRRHAVICFR